MAFWSEIMVPVHERPPQDQYDVIIVLGARVLANGKPGRTLTNRIQRAVELYHAGYAQYLLVSGGGGPTEHREAHVMKSIARSQGVPEKSIYCEAISRNTMQNAAASINIMQARRWRSALIVTDRFHMRRAVLAFRLYGAAVDVVPSSSNGIHIGIMHWWYIRLREYLALAWYGLRYLTKKIS